MVVDLEDREHDAIAPPDGSHDALDSVPAAERDAFDDIARNYDETAPEPNHGGAGGENSGNDAGGGDDGRDGGTGAEDAGAGEEGRSRLRLSNRGRWIMGGSLGGVSGIALFGLLFLGPTLSPLNFLRGFEGINLDSNDGFREQRTIRILRDIMNKEYRIRRRSVGRYEQNPVSRKIKDVQLNKFRDRMQAEGWDFVYDEFEVSARDGSTKKFNADGEKLFPTRLQVPEQHRADFGDYVSLNDQRLRIDSLDPRASEIDINRAIKKMYRDVYPNTGFVRRTLFGGELVKTHLGFSKIRLWAERLRSNKERSVDNLIDTQQAGANITSDPDRLSELSQGDDVDADGNVVRQNDLDEEQRIVVETVRETLNEGGTLKQGYTKAKSRLSGKFGGGKVSLVATAGILACIGKKTNDLDTAAQYSRFAAVMRNTLAVAAAIEEALIYGDADLEGLGDVLKRFQYDYDVISEDTGELLRLTSSYANTDAYERTLPTTVVVAGEAITVENLIERDGSQISTIEKGLRAFGGAASAIPGFDPGCDLVTGFFGSTFGQIIGWAGDLIGTGIACTASLGGACLARIGGIAAQEAFFYALAKQIAEPAFGVVCITGEQCGLVFDQGMGYIDSVQSVDALPVDNATYNNQIITTMNKQVDEFGEKPFSERYFATDVNGSLMHSVAVWRSKALKNGAIENIASIIKLPLGGITSMFKGSAVRAAGLHENTRCQSTAVVGEDAGCVPFANYGRPLYSYDPSLPENQYTYPSYEVWGYDQAAESDVILRTEDTRVNLIDVHLDQHADLVNQILEDPSAQNVQSFMQLNGYTDAKAMQEFMLKVGGSCMGYVHRPNGQGYIDDSPNTPRLMPKNDPQRFGNETANKNKEFNKYCKREGSDVLDSANNRRLYAMMGRFVSDLREVETMVAASNEQVTQEVSGELIKGDPYTDSSDVFCYAGTDDLSIHTGYVSGQPVQMRLCALPNLSSTSSESQPGSTWYVEGADGHAIVNSRMSEAWFKLVEAAKNDGILLEASSSFRTMEHQKSLCNAACRAGDNSAVAAPGHSSHQAGTAIDFANMGRSVSGTAFKRGATCESRAFVNTPAYQWLVANAAAYGLKQYATEAWHWDSLEAANRC